MQDRFRVLLLWPGALYGDGRVFGVPHLLSLAGALRSPIVDVRIIDLDLERAFGAVRLDQIVSSNVPLMGLSCFSLATYI